MITFHHKDDENEYVNGEITITNDSPCYLDDVTESFVSFLKAVGYHPKSIKRSLERNAEELEELLSSCLTPEQRLVLLNNETEEL